MSLSVKEENISDTNIYSPVDAIIMYGDKKFLVEVKVRHIKYARADNHFLEVKKLNGINEEMKRQQGDVALYVNFFSDHEAIVYNISTADKFEIKTIKMNKTTASYNGKVEKDVLCCDPKFGVRFVNDVNDGWRLLR